MIDVKCKGCDKLLFKTEFCYVAIKCPRCRLIFEYKVITNLHITNQYDMLKSDKT